MVKVVMKMINCFCDWRQDCGFVLDGLERKIGRKSRGFWKGIMPGRVEICAIGSGKIFKRKGRFD